MVTPQNSRVPTRDPRTGHLLPGARLNPGGRPAKKAFRAELKRLIGEHGEVAALGILDIAEGRTTIEQLVRKPYPHEDTASVALIPKVVIQPSIRERLDAYAFLYEQLNGKATVDVEVAHEHSVSVRDYSKLSDTELASLEAALAKAELPSGDVVEGEVVE